MGNQVGGRQPPGLLVASLGLAGCALIELVIEVISRNVPSALLAAASFAAALTGAVFIGATRYGPFSRSFEFPRVRFLGMLMVAISGVMAILVLLQLSGRHL